MHNIPLENAMFAGITAIITYYQPLIRNEALRNEDKSRAPLNAPDIEQECRRVILRCWEKQRKCSDVKNFDILVKCAIKRMILSMRGKEYSLMRGRFNIPFMSELEREDNHSPEELLGATDGISYDDLLTDLEQHIADERLQETFRYIAVQEEPEYLNPRNLTPPVRIRIASALQIGELELLDRLGSIQFVLSMFRANFVEKHLLEPTTTY